MELTNQGLELSPDEARDLSLVFAITGALNNLMGRRLSGVVQEPTDAEREIASQLAHDTFPRQYPESGSEQVIIGPERLEAVSKIVELALVNRKKVTDGLCTISIVDGYDEGLRPHASDVMAMTEEIRDKIRGSGQGRVQE
jgi:hypothetical protein